MSNPHAGPISVEQLRQIVAGAATKDGWNPYTAAEDLNALIAPRIQAARVDAEAEMRERCIQAVSAIIDRIPFGETKETQPETRVSTLIDLRDTIDDLPLPPAEESFLREKIERAIEAGIEYAGDRKEWNPSPGDWHGPERPTYESIMKEASKP